MKVKKRKGRGKGKGVFVPDHAKKQEWLSRFLVRHLRHEAQGFVWIAELAQLRQLQHVSEGLIRQTLVGSVGKRGARFAFSDCGDAVRALLIYERGEDGGEARSDEAELIEESDVEHSSACSSGQQHLPQWRSGVVIDGTAPPPPVESAGGVFLAAAAAFGAAAEAAFIAAGEGVAETEVAMSGATALSSPDGWIEACWHYRVHGFCPRGGAPACLRCAGLRR